MIRDWLKNLTIADMPNDDMKLVAEQCGMEVAIILLEKLNGIIIYIPKIAADKRFIKKYVNENYDGRNAKNLAVEIGVSEQYIYKLLAGDNGKKSPNQLTFLEEKP